MEASGLAPQAQGQHPDHTAKKPERIFAAVLLGQLLSFLLALTSLISALLASKGVSLPATQTVPNYALLAIVYGVLQLGRREKRQNGFGGYAAVAFLDVEANFLVVMAFRYTFITSVQLLNSFTVPCAFIMSWFVLSAQYKALHCAGAALCLASLALFVYADSGNSEASDVVLGDGLVIMGAMLYAACNVTQEKLLRKGTTVEVLACMGLFGLFWSSIQAASLEHEAVRQADWTPQAVSLLAGYTLTMFAFYSLVPWVLQWSGAAVLNLSLLTSNLWAALARALLLGGFPQKTAMAFSGSLFMVSVGLVLFTCGGTVYPKKAPEEERYRVIRFGDSGGSQQETPRFWRRGTFSGGRGRKVSEGESEGQPLWWRAGRMSGKDPEKATEDADKTGGQKDVDGDVGAAAAPASCSPAAHAVPQEHAEKEQSSEFWVSRLPSLPGEGAITADPYSKVGSSVQRSPSTPPAKPPA